MSTPEPISADEMRARLGIWRLVPSHLAATHHDRPAAASSSSSRWRVRRVADSAWRLRPPHSSMAPWGMRVCVSVDQGCGQSSVETSSQMRFDSLPDQRRTRRSQPLSLFVERCSQLFGELHERLCPSHVFIIWWRKGPQPSPLLASRRPIPLSDCLDHLPGCDVVEVAVGGRERRVAELSAG